MSSRTTVPSSHTNSWFPSVGTANVCNCRSKIRTSVQVRRYQRDGTFITIPPPPPASINTDAMHREAVAMRKAHEWQGVGTNETCRT